MRTRFPTWFPNTGFWWTDNRGVARWEGPDQVEDPSSWNINRCYQFLLALPYQRTEDLARLEAQRRVSVAEAIVEESLP